MCLDYFEFINRSAELTVSYGAVKSGFVKLWPWLCSTLTHPHTYTHINTHPHPSLSRCIYIVGIERNLVSRTCSSKFPPQHLWNYSLQFSFWNGEIGHWTDYLLHKHGDLSLDLGKQQQKNAEATSWAFSPSTGKAKAESSWLLVGKSV